MIRYQFWMVPANSNPEWLFVTNQKNCKKKNDNLSLNQTFWKIKCLDKVYTITNVINGTYKVWLNEKALQCTYVVELFVVVGNQKVCFGKKNNMKVSLRLPES